MTRAPGRHTVPGVFGAMADTVEGILESTKKGGAVLRDPARSFRPDPSDPVVPRPALCKTARTVKRHRPRLAG